MLRVGDRVKRNPRIFGHRVANLLKGTVTEFRDGLLTVQWDGLVEDVWNPGTLVPRDPQQYQFVELVPE